MSVNVVSRIVAWGQEWAAVEELRRHLAVDGHSVDAAPNGGPTDPVAYQLLVVAAGRPPDDALDLVRRCRDRLGEHGIPILYLTPDERPEGRVAGFEAGADASLTRAVSAGELRAQVRALLRSKQAHDRLAERAEEFNRLNRRLQVVNKQIDQEMELAQRLQASFLPHAMPEVPGCRFAVHHLLCGRVGGDFYDVFRLDERHVGFYVADAMGHGVPASLLTIFIKKGVRAKEVFGRQYRLVPPGEVLSRLNRDLIDQQLDEMPFITMAYALYDHEARRLCLARAGHPYPLLVPFDGPPRLLQQEGLLLGVADASYSAPDYTLRTGDKVLFYSDGIDTAQFDGHDVGTASLLACAARHRSLPVNSFVARLARDLFAGPDRPDDVTLLGLEITPSALEGNSDTPARQG